MYKFEILQIPRQWSERLNASSFYQKMTHLMIEMWHLFLWHCSYIRKKKFMIAAPILCNMSWTFYLTFVFVKCLIGVEWVGILDEDKSKWRLGEQTYLLPALWLG